MIIELVQTHVIAKCTAQDESKAFFLKMVGDYYRYICEVAINPKLETAKVEARRNYEDAN